MRNVIVMKDGRMVINTNLTGNTIKTITNDDRSIIATPFFFFLLAVWMQ